MSNNNGNTGSYDNPWVMPFIKKGRRDKVMMCSYQLHGPDDKSFGINRKPDGIVDQRKGDQSKQTC